MTKLTSNWTEKHDQFCLKNSIPPAAKLLWQWLIREGVDQEVEPDLSEFNHWVEKHRGKGYAHNYLKQMFNLLVENRVIQVVRQYSWKIFKLLVRPLEWLNPPKKQKLHNPNSTYKTPSSNPENSVDLDIQQQHILSNQQLMSQEGIHFDTEETEVLNRPQFEIKAALLLFKLRGAAEKIMNPEGWVRQCLRRRYWEQPTNYGSIAKHFGGAAMEIEDYF
ncbi:hypothetical protein A0J48_025940 [Sphaerospermopsis aphanizomenoides BCCUSP55]|uniref:hypothetical protein n=1 Tax=Sphaerospermopsis aphanizomenoides TaxID=459663 RepID=UPI001906669F|nr:hypothetical protein [Sphaerospermopsis aphanizomenoides]MBK1990909.1 hypothetical protein [Sphaerospermopsis aphanizomenoides BCCUSP55]